MFPESYRSKIIIKKNEAIVTQIMREYIGELEVLDVSHLFTYCDVKIRRGLTNWKVMIENANCEKELIHIKSKEDEAFKNYKNIIEESCFPDSLDLMEKIYKIQNCVRILPHDSDTGGFFITLFKRIKINDNIAKLNSNQKTAVKSDKGFNYLDEETRNWIKNYYGLIDEFPLEQLITKSETEKKINYISTGVYNFLKTDKRNNLNIINCGVKMFGFNKLKNLKNEETHCKYRVCQDGLLYLLPFMKKRLLFCNTNFLIKILKQTDVLHEEIDDVQLKEHLSLLKSGCVILIASKSEIDYKIINDDKLFMEFLKENYIDSLCCYTSAVRLSSMINEEHQHVFNLKYNI